MFLLKHVKLNRVMLKIINLIKKNSFIKNIKHAYNIISFFQKAMSQRYENRK